MWTGDGSNLRIVIFTSSSASFPAPGMEDWQIRLLMTASFRTQHSSKPQSRFKAVLTAESKMTFLTLTLTYCPVKQKYSQPTLFFLTHTHTLANTQSTIKLTLPIDHREISKGPAADSGNLSDLVFCTILWVLIPARCAEMRRTLDETDAYAPATLKQKEPASRKNLEVPKTQKSSLAPS